MRVALVSVNAARSDTNAHWPHYGLVLLATVLQREGHAVRVFDQSFLGEPDDAFAARVIAFRPDVVGLSLYTTHVTRGMKLARQLKDGLPAARFLAGGPHASLYAEEVAAEGLFGAVVRGEGESVIARLVADGSAAGVVDSPPTEGAAIPAADFTLADGHAGMRWVPIQLSRGCPFNCSFCEVKKIASRRIRYRDLDVCLAEIRASLVALPKAHTIRIVDDCPTLDRPRFKDFLRRYIASGMPARLSIDNMRADCVDEELLDLLKQCRIPYVCVAAESANPDVFRLVDKGEKIEEIVAAAQMVRRKGIPLYMCFVIGLPGSSFAAEMDSLRLAKRLKPDLVYWNMFLPHRGTRAREWFAEHGTIFDEADRFSVPAYDLTFSSPATESPEFSRDDRIRAYLTCVLETVSFVFTPRALVRAFSLAHRYRLWPSIPVMLVRLPWKFGVYARLMLGRLRERLLPTGARRAGGPAA